ncbi:MAG: thiamine pyrophosphate-binding protein, partial [Methanobacterium sp.]|nr:thiamine pyrophosphate-binding protein [Methanobacterium sp.]
LKKAIETLTYTKKGPIHLNFPKDVLESYVNESIIKTIKYENEEPKTKINPKTLHNAIKLLKSSQKPLILAGAGITWSHASDSLKKFAVKNKMPVVTTYPARGVISEESSIALGMIGLRGTEASNYAGKNCDVLIALGCKFSERTLMGIGNCKIIHVNIDETTLKGDIKIHGDVKEFLDRIMDVKINKSENWYSNINKLSNKHYVNTNYTNIPIKPQKAIKEILDAAGDSVIVNDAGTHTTWVTLLMTVKTPSSLLFSGGFGPMGYGIPGAIGASFAKPNKSIITVVGDGDFQMTSQELATINEFNLPIIICIINNNSLRIIKQWQEMQYKESYQVELENPDFIKLSDAYHIPALRLDSPGEIYSTVKKVLTLNKPYLIEVLVDTKEEIPLPEVLE